MANRMKRKSIAKETVEILQRGDYETEAGQTVLIQPMLDEAVRGTRTYTPEEFAAITEQVKVLKKTKPVPGQTRFMVVNGTTLASVRELLAEDATRKVACLNFASAKNPGGGFLGGSQAQEESLARASGLYACINGCRKYYDTNRACSSCLYTDHLIYSPEVPVFRDDRDALLEWPYLVSMITAPAVNAGAVRSNEPNSVSRIAEVMLHRMEYVLSVAYLQQHDTLVLGAWGCGVFKNDARLVAGWFYQLLCQNETFQNAFDRVVFAVLDRTENAAIIQPFQECFSGEQSS